MGQEGVTTCRGLEVVSCVGGLVLCQREEEAVQVGAQEPAVPEGRTRLKGAPQWWREVGCQRLGKGEEGPIPTGHAGYSLSEEKTHAKEVFRGDHGPDKEKACSPKGRRKMLEAILTCNDSMKALVTSLVGGAGLFTKGWLKRALKGIERQLSNEKLKFDGLACRVNAARNWKTEIILSTYGI